MNKEYKLIGEAMQMAWDEWCADCHTVPDAFHVDGPSWVKVSSEFKNSNFVRQVVNALHCLGYKIEQNKD